MLDRKHPGRSPSDAGLVEGSMSTRLLAAVLATVLVAACDEKSPTAPSVTDARLTIAAITPASGGSVTASGSIPGAFIARGSGLVSIPMTVSAGRELPWAQLSVYLMTSDTEYCGQNLPDAPTYGPFRATDTITVTVSGFQVYRLPCQVVAVRAYLHTRNSGLLVPPNASETAAQGSVTASFTIR
jgi:hypothetical protein